MGHFLFVFCFLCVLYCIRKKETNDIEGNSGRLEHETSYNSVKY